MCPEMARQNMLGLTENTESTSTMIGTAVHYGIEQCLLETMMTGDSLSREDMISGSMNYWLEHNNEVVWTH